MKFKANTPNTTPMTLREETQMKYNRCRANLLLVLLFTVIISYVFNINIFIMNCRR